MRMKVMRSRWVLGLLMGVAIWFGAAPAWAGEPPSDPILRVETGMHQTKINGIAVDAANQYLVTGSDDKTVRVWELATGRLLTTLRPPIGEGPEGRINAVAISPDGRTIAAGGVTGIFWEGGESIYVFDRVSGKLLRRVTTGHSNSIGHLAYSPDGRWLAAALGAKNGIQIYRTADYGLAAKDGEYADTAAYATFDKAGRLATTSYDGSVRLYDQRFRLIAKRRVPGGSQPFGISFSPDGTKVVVGFDDANTVKVLSGYDLSVQHAPDTSNFSEGTLSSVTWSIDGQRICAGGRTKNVSHSKMIRCWENGGYGRRTDMLSGASRRISDLIALADGSLAFGAFDPAFGVLDPLGRVRFFRQNESDYTMNSREEFLISQDGMTVHLGYERSTKSPEYFSVDARTLDSGRSIESRTFRPPLTKAPGLVVTDWENSHTPKLNGHSASLPDGAMVRSLAIASDQKRFVMGLDSRVACFDRSGREEWETRIPYAAFAVNVSGNGNVVVVAHSDDTIHWYRMTDGQELLALYAKNKAWILWTLSGFYDASPGADDLIGWHINHGRDRAGDFFPAAQFRNTYYRPDVIAKVLETLDEGAAVRLATIESGRKAQTAALTEQLPPVVTILSPGEGAMVSASDVTVRFSLRSPSGEPVTGVKALVDGRPVSVARDLKVTAKAQAESDVQELRVTIPERDAEIAILAENRYSTSVPAVVRVKWTGRGPGQADAFVIQPRLYILAIGVSQYQNKDLTLGFPAKDAQDFGAVLHSQKGRLYRDVTAKVLTDGEATKDDILDGLDWLRKETTSKDVAMLFLAGHGVNDSNGIYYFLPTNANPDKLMRTGVVFSDIKNTLASIAGKTLFFVDTCHSGNIMGARRGVADINAVVNELASAENGAVVFASSTGKQYSLEGQAWGNGAFTKALVEGLGGKADYPGKGAVSINMLDLYLSERVKQLTGGKQTPTTTKPNTVPDFPIALLR